MTLDELRTQLLADDADESVVEECARAFERQIWRQPVLSHGFLDFVLEVLSDERIYAKPGVWRFLFALGSEDLEPGYVERIRAALHAGYASYSTDLMLRHMACDFLSRRLPPSDALGFLERAAEIEALESDPRWLVGIEILLNALDEGTAEHQRALRLLELAEVAFRPT